MRVQTKEKRPAGAFVAVRHRDLWFYTVDADLAGKEAFSLLTCRFQLQAPQTSLPGPIHTVPTS